MHTHVVHTANAVCVRCAYRLVSVRCVLLQFVAMPIGVSCSPFRFDAVRCSSSSRTFNPEVAGSNPARPIRKGLQIATSCAPLSRQRTHWVYVVRNNSVRLGAARCCLLQLV